MRKNYLLLILFAVLCNFNCMLYGSLNFANRSSALVLGDVNSKIWINGTDSINGWSEHSFIRNTPRGNSWLTSQTTYGYGDGETAPNNYMVYNNSSAIISLKPGVYNNSNAIVKLRSEMDTIDHGPEDIIIDSSTYTMDHDIYLSKDHTLQILNNCEIDGNGHTIHFPDKSLFIGDVDKIVTVADDSELVFKNVTLEYFDDSAIRLGTYSSVSFGEHVTIELNRIQPLSMPWIFRGTEESFLFDNISTIRGGSLILGEHEIMASNNMLLCFARTIINDLHGTNLTSDDSMLAFYNTSLHLSDDYTFDSGAMFCLGDVKLKGPHTFNFASNNSLMVAGSIFGISSALYLSDDITFNYAPTSDSRDLVVLTSMNGIKSSPLSDSKVDLLTQFNPEIAFGSVMRGQGSFSNSKLHLDGCTLMSTTTGMRLSYGELIVEGKNFINNNATSLSEATCFENLDVTILPGATLDVVTGILDLQNQNPA